MYLDYIGSGKFLDVRAKKEYSCSQVIEIIKAGGNVSFVQGYGQDARWHETKVIAELEMPNLDGIGVAGVITGLSKFKSKLSDIARNRKDDLELTPKGVFIWKHSYSGNDNLYQVVVEHYTESEKEMRDRLEVADAFDKAVLDKEIEKLKEAIEENKKKLDNLMNI